MASVNKVIIVGRLGQDPEVRYAQSGDAVCTLSVATSKRWKDKNSGQMQEKTEWHRLVIWGKRAETAAEYLKKGSQAYFEGELETRKWTDGSGVERYTTEIKVVEFQFLDSAPKEGGGQAPAPQQRQQAPRQQPVQQQRPAQQRQAPPAAGMDTYDDDIPF